MKYQIRDQKVILDSDVAELYGVETKAINQAIKRNPVKFPDGFLIELTSKEWETLKSQIVTSKNGEKRGGRGSGHIRAKTFGSEANFCFETVLAARISLLPKKEVKNLDFTHLLSTIQICLMIFILLQLQQLY